MHLLSRPRRPRRAGEWTPAAAVTFIAAIGIGGALWWVVAVPKIEQVAFD